MKWARLLLGCLVIAAIPFLLDAWTGHTHARGLHEAALPPALVVEELPVVERSAPAPEDTVGRYVALGVGVGAVAVLTRQVGEG